MSLYSSTLIVLPLDEVHVGAGVQQGNILPGLPYFPGRVIRGALAGWAVRNGVIDDDKDNSDFYSIFGEFQLDGYTVSYPFCYYRGYLPAPLSLFEIKGQPVDVHAQYAQSETERVVYRQQDLISYLADAQGHHGPIDFLCREQWPSDVQDHVLKPAHGCLVGGRLKRAAPMLLRLRAPHAEDTGRVGAGREEGGLFAEELLPRAMPGPHGRPFETFYSGDLVFERTPRLEAVFSRLWGEDIGSAHNIQWDAVANIWRQRDPRQVMFIGHRRVPAIVLACEPRELDMATQDISTLTFTTPYKALDGTDPFPLDVKAVFPEQELTSSRHFCAETWLGGWRKLGEGAGEAVLPTAAALAAGSCVRLEEQVREETKKNELSRLAQLGAGGDSRNGFGRFAINHPIHEVL